MGAEAARLRLTRGVTLTKHVEAESGDPEDWSFLRPRPALLGLLTVVSICVGASLPSSPFKQEMGGTWFFGEADWPTTTLMLPGVVAVYGGMILFVRVWYGLFQTAPGPSRGAAASTGLHARSVDPAPPRRGGRFSARTCSPTPPRAR